MKTLPINQSSTPKRAPGPSVLDVLRGLRGDLTEQAVAAGRAYGDVVHVPTPGDPTYLVYHPDVIEQVLLLKRSNYNKARLLKAETAFLGNGLLSNDGESWLTQRRMMQPAFHHQQIAAYAHTMQTFTERMLETWHDGQRRDVQNDMMRLTLEIVVKTLFGAEGVDEERRTGAALTTVLDHFARKLQSRVRLPQWLPTRGQRAYAAAIRDLNAVVFEIVAARRRSGTLGDDLLALLLAARDENGTGMTDGQLRDEVVTLFLAGHETTAQTLAFTFFLLGTHPTTQTRLLQELDTVLGGRAPTLADVAHLPYLDAVIKESMRLYPAAPNLARQAVADDELGGYHIGAGATVLVPVFAVHHDARWYHAPDAFQPERWLAGLDQQLPRFAYLPFGGGPRLCIGNNFALMELRLILATVLQRVVLEPVRHTPPTLVSSITIRARDGMPVTVRQRTRATA